MMKPDRQTLLLFLKGMAMGAADSVPGVSGGTIALITNIYEELVRSIRSVGLPVLGVLKQQGLSAAWRHINGNFLLTLGSGILLSLILLARFILLLMENYLPYLLAFFAGLVLASIRFVATRIPHWNVQRVLLLATGAGIALVLALLPIREGSGGLLYYFICGAIAICAMILPGISGAFILVLLGAYGPVLEALSNFHWPVMMVFAGGCLVGLMSFSRLLSWLLEKFHEATLALLTGMLVGSLYLLWPWRVGSEILLDSHAFTSYRHVLPETYAVLTGASFSPVICLSLLAAGIVLVVGLELLVDTGGE